MSHVELFTTAGSPIKDHVILYEDSTGELRPLAQIRGNTAAQRSLAFPAVITKRLRILALRGPDHQPFDARLNEIELY